jgi:hypothetical protein
MNIIELNNAQKISSTKKLVTIYEQFDNLLSELRKHDLPIHIKEVINSYINEINTSTLTGSDFIKLVKLKQSSILKQIEKELKIVPKNYYRNIWMVIGMSGIGMPVGVAFGLSMGNIALLGLGFPIGMAVGMAVGASLDKKAIQQGKQLNIEIKQ